MALIVLKQSNIYSVLEKIHIIKESKIKTFNLEFTCNDKSRTVKLNDLDAETALNILEGVKLGLIFTNTALEYDMGITMGVPEESIKTLDPDYDPNSKMSYDWMTDALDKLGMSGFPHWKDEIIIEEKY